MEKYKKTLNRRIFMLAAMEFAIGILLFYNAFWASSKIHENYIYEFQSGGASALAIMGAILVTRYRKALQDENKLKILYNREHDERLIAIRAKAGLPMILFTSIAMIVIGTILGYINITIFYILAIAAVCQMLVACIVKLIYKRRL